MAEHWTPQDTQVHEIVHLLTVLNNPAAAEQQWEAQKALTAFMENPEFGLYLSHIFANPMSVVPPAMRQLAGLVLKNVAKAKYASLPDAAKQVLQANTLRAAQDEEHSIRITAGSVISTILSKTDIRAWPALLPTLVMMLDSGQEAQVEGAFDSLLKMCEESGVQLDDEDLGRPLNGLVPKMIGFFNYPKDTVRKYAVGCINNLIALMPQALVVHMDVFLQGLSALATDSSPGVRRLVCKAIVTLAQVDPKLLMPSMEGFCSFMLTAMKDADELVAIEAGEFWQAYCKIADNFEGRSRWEEMAGILPTLIPVLLDGMVFSADDIASFPSENALNDESVPDRPEDLRPVFHRHKGGGGDADEDALDEWNLRKCSASDLDSLAETFGHGKMLPVLLPCLQERLNSSNIWIRESAILALGAVAFGCIHGLVKDLPSLFPFLLLQVGDPTPQIRSIACWTLSRYGAWVVSEEEGSIFLWPVLQAFTQRCLDSNKKVQEAACSAFATLADVACRDLEPYLEHIVECLIGAMRKYQKRNLIFLYDTIGTLADAMGPSLATPQFNTVLVPLLLGKWSQMADEDSQSFPLLECLTSVAQAMGVSFQEFAAPTFHRCCRIIGHTLLQQAAAEDEKLSTYTAPEKEFIVCALDLLSGMAEGLGAGIEGLVASSNLLSMLWECSRDSDPSVRQSAFALLGELAKSCMPRIVPALPQYLQELMANLKSSPEPTDQHVCNNVAWAIGEIATWADKEVVDGFVEPVAARLVDVFLLDDLSVVPEPLLSTISITVGRLGRVSPERMAPTMERYVEKWCHCLRFIADQTEKEGACTALCLMIRQNPAAIIKGFPQFCMAVFSWHQDRISPALAAMFRDILHGIKERMGPQWHSFRDYPVPLQEYLSRTYDL